MNKEKIMGYIRNKERLPKFAYSLLPSDDRQVILIYRDERGYSPYFKFNDSAQAITFVNNGNDLLDVEPEAAEAMLLLSMRA